MRLNFSPNRARCSAFSLAEVVVATGLMGFLFGTVLLVVGQGMQVIQGARENLRATQIIQEVTEVLRLYTWSQVTGGSYLPAAFTNYFDPLADPTNRGVAYYGRIAVQSPGFSVGYSNALKQVTITVNWTNRSIPHTKSLTTLVSQYGIQRYIY